MTFEIGTVESCTEVVVVDDSLSLEGEETIVVSFTAPPGTQQGSPPSSTVSILDNDGQEHLQKCFPTSDVNLRTYPTTQSRILPNIFI